MVLRTVWQGYFLQNMQRFIFQSRHTKEDFTMAARSVEFKQMQSVFFTFLAADVIRGSSC
jgi:hypothetical protein